MALYLRGDAPASVEAPDLGWLVNELSEDWRTVHGWIPDRFEAYARILHPANTSDGRTASWREVAEWSGQELDRRADWCRIERREDGETWSELVGQRPSMGDLEPDQEARLYERLAGSTSAPDRIRVLTWEGHASHPRGLGYAPLGSRRPAGRSTRRWRVPWRTRIREATDVNRHTDHRLVDLPPKSRQRRYLLGMATLFGPESSDAVAGEWTPADLFWPEDVAWFAATDTDAYSTYIGGPAALVDALLNDDILDVVTAFPSDPFDGLDQHA